MRIASIFSIMCVSVVLLLAGCTHKKSNSTNDGVTGDVVVVTGQVFTGSNDGQMTGNSGDGNSGDTQAPTQQLNSPPSNIKDPLEDLSDENFDHKSLKDPKMDELMNYIDSLLVE